GGIGAENAEHSFNLVEASPRIFQKPWRQFSKAALKIDQAILPDEQLARWTARSDCAADVQKTTSIVVNLVSNISVQCFPRQIQPLLSIAHAFEQFSGKRAFGQKPQSRLFTFQKSIE